MTSYSGSVAYLEYVSLTDKGGIAKGDVFNSVFGHGPMSGEKGEARQNFTSQVIVEAYDGTPALEAEVDGLSYTDGTTVKFATYKLIGKKTVDGKEVDAVEYSASATAPEGMTVNKIAYVSKQFQMNHIPATEIPAIGPRMKHIPLVAEPRRIAVRYDQITA